MICAPLALFPDHYGYAGPGLPLVSSVCHHYADAQFFPKGKRPLRTQLQRRGCLLETVQ